MTRLALAALAAGLTLLPLSAQVMNTEPLTNQRVAALVRSGLRQEEVIRLIATAPQIAFNLTPGDMDVLLKEGVSEEVIKAMAARSSAAPLAGPQSPAREPSLTPSRTTPARSGGAPRSTEEAGPYLTRGDWELGLTGTALIPHSSPGDTLGFGQFRTGYYVAGNSLVGADITVVAAGDAQDYLLTGFYRYLQHTGNPRVFPYVGAAAGANIAHLGTGTSFGLAPRGFSQSNFVARAEVGVKCFVARHVALEISYNLVYIKIAGAGFSDTSASMPAVGLSYTFGRR